MVELIKQNCGASRAMALLINDEDVRALIPEIPDWNSVVLDDGMRLTHGYKFKDCVQAMAFTNRLEKIDEAAGHNPAILTEWGEITFPWCCHKIRGLHKNDLIMAACTDEVLEG